MNLLRRLGEFLRPAPQTRPEWPDDGSWTLHAHPCGEFQLDAGFAVTPYVPSWMLPIGAPDDPPVPLPDLPRVAGHVLTADAIGRETELIRYFSRLPSLGDRSSWRETAEFSCLSVNLLLRLPEVAPVVADMFAASRQAAGSLLDDLSGGGEKGGIVYDNLDQGWALRILVQDDAVFVLEWNWETAHPRAGARALRLPRPMVAAQAIAARHRLDELHGTMLGALGRDLWSCPARD